MKQIRERFRKQIAHQSRQNYFSTIRKQLLEQKEFDHLYQNLLNNEQDLIVLVENFGYGMFCKYIHQLIDQRFFSKLYQTQKYFLTNLKFLSILLSCAILPVQQVQILISALAEILSDKKVQLNQSHVKQIFEIMERVMVTAQYSNNCLQIVINKDIISYLYDIVIKKQMSEYFYRLICLSKTIGNQNLTDISNQKLIHCLQLHILTSNDTEQLYRTYYILGDMFERVYTKDTQLYDYGSILSKIKEDIKIDKLVDPITYFLMKALNNESLNRIILEMNLMEDILAVILRSFSKKSKITVFGLQSIWCIFRRVIQFARSNNKFQMIQHLQWQALRQKLEQKDVVRYPYVKIEIDLCLRKLCKTELRKQFGHLVESDSFAEEFESIGL